MKLLNDLPTSLLLLLSLTYLTSALLTTEEVVALADGKKLSSSADSSNPPPPKPAVDGVGTKDAPVDGKDGRPHLGPFVETSAERDRKKAKESGDETKVSKPVPSAITAAPSDEVRKMPETNDGVMDDPNRTGPKEGTRGTEGGISEKSKDKKEGQTDTGKSEKKPDPPKEIPPLPHSEQENLGQKTMKEEGKKGKEVGLEDDEKPKDNKQKELGGLEVTTTCLRFYMESIADISGYRNLLTSHKSLTTSPTLFQIQPRKAILLQSSNHLRHPFPP